ncbi:MAG: PQQ-binding-like beta-propeller repeat protein [Alphaproteobacteria bacterium]|nr:PQQ-binding-like beta-propeller repeat protein [Alphaproteobacteria bacterium]
MMKHIAGAVILAALWVSPAMAQTPGGFSAPPKQFDTSCEGCHGEGGAGGDRAPALTNNITLRAMTEAQIRDLIKSGTPGGMPAFSTLPDNDLRELASWLRSLNQSALDTKPAGNVAAGEALFFSNGQCAGCHMVQGHGKANGPDLSAVGRRATVRELELVLENPTSQMGIHTTASCPRWAFCPDDSWHVVNVKMRDGSALRGFARGRAEHDLELQTLDGRLLFLTDRQYAQIVPEKNSIMPPFKGSAEQRRDLIAYLASLGGGTKSAPRTEMAEKISAEAMDRVVNPKPGEWPTYNGVLGGNRHSPLSQINTGNVDRLQMEWVYSLEAPNLETTPIVVDGVMYVTSPDKVCALGAGTGRQLWCFSYNEPTADGRRRNPGAMNRGVAILGDRVFFATTDAHLICLNRLTGGLMWNVNMPQTKGAFGSSSAPMVVGDLVIAGVSGGDSPLLGFLVAYHASTGEEAWRFRTVPRPGEPGSETWKGTAIGIGGGATWLTGSYDAQTGTLYWTVGNPFPATDAAERGGENLYTNCVIALDVKTGKLKWYYQFTPNDLHDWDATEPVLLVDADYGGRPRKLLLQANRNGFLFVLDRITGEFLMAKPFVRKMNWSSGYGADGKPRLLPGNDVTPAGVKGCPSVRGATNWYATSFSPETRLFYVMAVEDCSIYRQTSKESQGYEGVRDPNDPGLKYLRALDIQTGKTMWEIPQEGPQEANYSGVLSTAGGLVFYGETGGGFAAVDAKSGKTLWTVHGNQPWRGCPMTYMLNGRQYVAVASGSNILTFALK